MKIAAIVLCFLLLSCTHPLSEKLTGTINAESSPTHHVVAKIRSALLCNMSSFRLGCFTSETARRDTKVAESIRQY